jgi:hypothetical protein
MIYCFREVAGILSAGCVLRYECSGRLPADDFTVCSWRIIYKAIGILIPAVAKAVINFCCGASILSLTQLKISDGFAGLSDLRLIWLGKCCFVKFFGT